MRLTSKQRNDYYAGGLIALIGIFAIAGGLQHDLGTLLAMGPGYFPVAIGALLVVLGILIAISAASEDAEEQGELQSFTAPGWRGAICIIAGPILFIVCGAYLGFVAATFSCVFVSSLGDREAKLKSSVILATGATLFGVVLFSYVLGVAFPLFAGVGR